jgi:signal transduction histidine kinase
MARPHPIVWLRERPLVYDALVAGVLGVIGVLTLAFAEADPDPPSRWLGLPLVLLSTLPLFWRRRSPAAVLAVVLVPQFILDAANWGSAGWLNLFIAAYSVGAYMSGRALWRIAIAAIVAATVFLIAGLLVDEELIWQGALSLVVVLAAMIVLGDNMRRRRERAAELVERVERAEREKELLAQQQVQLERTRIARELHDVVAHSVSVMIIQAGAARRHVATSPDQATMLLETIESTGREAMIEMRRVLGVLRSERAEDDARQPQPSLDTLPDLVASAPDLPVQLQSDADVTAVPPGIELSAYRVVQEALTNIRRHAGRVDRVDVSIRQLEGSLQVEICDDGRGAAHAPHEADDEAGYGILGMRERVGLFGGQLIAGPRAGGGWRVLATFPLEPS